MTQDPGFLQVDRCFRTHEPSALAQELMALLLERGRGLALAIVETVPPCRERAMALTELEAAVTHARAGLAREDGVAVVCHREQMFCTTAPPRAVPLDQEVAILGLHKLLASVIRNFAAGDLDRLYLSADERTLLDGFLNLHGDAQ
jgi:hypothetical protein